MQVLAGDIGGTKTLLAIVEVAEPREKGGLPRLAVTKQKRYDSRRFPGLGGLCRAFADELGRDLPPRAGFGVAGPVAHGRSHTTNLPWILDERDLAETLQIQSVRLANDFHALALGIPFVSPEHQVTLNEGVHNPRGPQALIGAGTGLGEGVTVVGSDGRRTVMSTEGGHTDFAPRSELEMGILRFLSARYSHVSWERLLSGDGLVNLAEALAHITGSRMPAALAEAVQHDREAAPALVTEAAHAGDPLCTQVLEVFCRLYGAEAGNLALKTLATGGVYVAGGIAPRIVPQMKDGRFREAFFDKGRMRGLLEAMPVQIILDPNATLLGAAALALDEAPKAGTGP